MMPTEKEILECLKQVRYSDKGDIVTLRMIGELEIRDNQLGFTIFFPQNFDPETGNVINSCEEVIEKAYKGSLVVKGNIKAKQKMVVLNDNLPDVKNIIAVASGKGGVGKSTVAVNLAVAMAKKGYKTGIIDADIFGPSLPKMFGVEGEEVFLKKVGEQDKIIPIDKYGVKMLSIGFFVKPDDALIWRGPMASSALKQLINQGDWNELDYLFIDMPPGTSDIHLTLVQELSLTGAVIVSTPQDVAIADAVKGVQMFRSENVKVPVLGIIENMSWFTPEELPENKYFIFGENGCTKLAEKYNVPLLGQIPLVMKVREGGDMGEPIVSSEGKNASIFMKLAEELNQQVDKRNAELPATEKVQIKN